MIRLAALALCALAAGAQASDRTAWAPAGWSPSGAPPAGAAAEQVVVAARAIPARTVLSAGDLSLAPASVGGGLVAVSEAVGQETQVALYAGRPVRPEDLGPPAIVERNALVLLRYVRGALSITAEGRALDRGAEGDRVRAMNLGSRTTVTGRIAADGAVEVN